MVTHVFTVISFHVSMFAQNSGRFNDILTKLRLPSFYNWVWFTRILNYIEMKIMKGKQMI